MYKNIFLTVMAFVMLLIVSCEKKEQMIDFSASSNSLYVTFLDGSGFFNPEQITPYGDTIKFVFSTHFPLESDELIDISSMRIKANKPTIVKVNGTSTNQVDLTKPTEIFVQSADGKERKHILVGEIRKSSEAVITSFSLPAIKLSGFLLESQKIVGLVAGGADLTNLVPEISITPHATISPAINKAQDFSKPVTYTVTSESGKSVQYVVKSITPDKVVSGFRLGSERLLWSKSLEELGINGIDNLTTSIAVTEKYLAVNTRGAENKYLDRFTGNVVGTMEMKGISQVNFQNFFITSDQAGHLLISNLVNAINNDLYVYKYNGVDDKNPVKLIQWKVTEAKWQVGRKISVKGDLSKNALIFLAAGISDNTILRWQVLNGELVSQTPVAIKYIGEKVWGNMADAISEGPNVTDNLFVSSNAGDFAYLNTSTGLALSQVNLSASGINITHSIDHIEFNKTKYLAAVNIASVTSGNAYLYNVTDPLLISTPPSAAEYKTINVFRSPLLMNNTNNIVTGDVALAVSKDGYKMVMYVMITNGSIAAYEFDCIDLTSL